MRAALVCAAALLGSGCVVQSGGGYERYGIHLELGLGGLLGSVADIKFVFTLGIERSAKIDEEKLAWDGGPLPTEPDREWLKNFQHAVRRKEESQ